MSVTIPLTIKVSAALKRELKKTARLRGQTPSATAREFLEEGIARHRPGGLLGAGKRFLQSEHLDPAEPAYAPDDWAS